MWGTEGGSGRPPTAPMMNQSPKEELENLRQRGLAKALQKHLQAVCRKLANEQAAADAALADIEARKANMSEFQVSSELVGLESAVLKATKWKAECRQKEREALILYQRYREKFRSSKHQQQQPPSPQSPESPAMSAKLAAPPPSSPPAGLSTPTIAEDEIPELFTPSITNMNSEDNDDHFRQYYRDQTKESEESLMEEALFLQENDNLSIVSGLTSVNDPSVVVNKSLLPMVERDVQEFLQQEQSAIQDLLEEETTSHNTHSDMDSVAKMAEQAESMAQQMQEMLHSFEPVSEESPSPKPCRVLDDEWVVYYDETFQREYYHHTPSGESRWESPMEKSVPAPSLMDESTSSVTTTNQEISPSSSRISLYRARLRKKRRRQRRLGVAAVALVLVATTGWAIHNTLERRRLEDYEKSQLMEEKRLAKLAEEKRRQDQAAMKERHLLKQKEEQDEEEARLEAKKRAPKEAARGALAMDLFCGQVTPDSPLASLCL